MTETNGDAREVPVALYDRLSTASQAKEGYASEGHMRELREELAATGRRVVAEIAEADEKRWMYDRPGVRRLLKLAEAGEIEEVWAWSWRRYGEGSVPQRLEEDLEDLGVALRALDDGGEGLGGKILRAVGGALSSEEQADRVRKSKMGLGAKAGKGHVIGSGRGPRYGFRIVRNERGRAVAYETCEPKMGVVRRIFEMLGAGTSIYAVQVALEESGVDAPRGGARWSRDTIKKIVREDTYLPHTAGELDALAAEGLLSGEVREALDPSRPYGIDYYGRTRTRRISRHTKKRRAEPAPRGEWTAIPVDLFGSGLDRARVLGARSSIEDNREPSRAGDRREWELSRGFLYCAECGRAMNAWAPSRRKDLFYYRCPNLHKARGNVPARCPNNTCHRAGELEFWAWTTFQVSADPENLVRLYDEKIAERSSRVSPEALKRRRSELELERRGYLKQNARGVISDAELDALLAGTEEERAQVIQGLEDAREADAGLERARQERDEAVRFIRSNGQFFFVDDPEEKRGCYRRLGARFEVAKDGALTLRFGVDLTRQGERSEAGEEGLRLTTTR